MSAGRTGPWTLPLGPLRLRVPLVPSLVTAAFLVLLCSLGFWQLDRAGQKARLGRSFEAAAQDHPIRIDPSLRDPQAVRYRPVQARGRYDADRQFLLDNRTHRGIAGYHVLTPLRLADGPAAVLVNRGWVPVGASRAVLPALPAPESVQAVHGIGHAPGPGALLLGPAGYETPGWPRVVQTLDLDAMSRALAVPLLPYTVRLDPDEPHGFVREWRAYYGIGPERHRAYAFQWFSLAVALGIIYLAMNLRRSGRD